MDNDDATAGPEPRPAAVRIGDAERESAVQALGAHMKAGRLAVDEYSERSGQAAEARTADELSTLFTDLPEPHPTLPGAPGSHAVEQVRSDAVATRPSGTPAQRVAGAVMGVSWIGAIALMFATGLGWWVFAIPIALSVVFGSVWGKGWQHELNGRDDRRERRGDRREERRDRRDDR